MSKNINIPLGQKKKEEFATINIGSNSFKIAIDPVSLEKLVTKCQEIAVELENVTVESLEDAKSVLKKSFTALLGKGSFKKVYAESGSITECMEVLEQVANSLADQLKK